MGFKEYLNESLLVETKVKVGGKEYASKKDAGIALAKQGKNEFQIERMTGLSAAGARWCYLQAKKGDQSKANKEPLKTVTIKKKDPKGNVEDVTTIRDTKENIDKELTRYNKLARKGHTYFHDDNKKKEPVKNKAQERREALEAYKKGEKYKPEPIELAPLDRNKSKTKAKEWMKKHGDDHNKEKELKAIQKEMDKLANEYDKLEDKERRLRNKGDISLIGAVEKRMDEIKKAMIKLNDKETELK